MFVGGGQLKVGDSQDHSVFLSCFSFIKKKRKKEGGTSEIFYSEMIR